MNKKRLPKSTYPIRYEVELDVDLDNFSYNGKELIDIELKKWNEIKDSELDKINAMILENNILNLYFNKSLEEYDNALIKYYEEFLQINLNTIVYMDRTLRKKKNGYIKSYDGKGHGCKIKKLQ